MEATGAPVAQVAISTATHGVLPTLGDVNGDGQLDLVIAPDDGRPELVRIFTVDSGELIGEVPGGSAGVPGRRPHRARRARRRTGLAGDRRRQRPGRASARAGDLLAAGRAGAARLEILPLEIP